MRNRIPAADRRLPKAVQSLWYSDERLKRDRKNTIAALNHDGESVDSAEDSSNFDIPGNSSDAAAVFRGRGLKPETETPADGAQEDRPTQTLAGASVRLEVANADLSGSTFGDVNLSGTRIKNARMKGILIHDADLTGSRLVDVNLTGVSIDDAAIQGLMINGVAVESRVGFGVKFESVSAIGDTDPQNIPVRDVGAAVAYYVNVLGFTCDSSSTDIATLRRDATEIGLRVSGADPEQASVYFAVNDVAALHRELTAKSASPSDLREDNYGDQRYRVCFVKEPYGVCFCFGQKITTPLT